MNLLHLQTCEDIITLVESSMLDLHWSAPKGGDGYVRAAHLLRLSNILFNEVRFAPHQDRDGKPYEIALNACVREMAELACKALDDGSLSAEEFDPYIVRSPDEADAEYRRLMHAKAA